MSRKIVAGRRRLALMALGPFTACLFAGNARGADAGAPAAAQVEEVIVTATRREEALQDVPISITALTAKTLKQDRIQSFQDVFQKVAGANFLPIKGSSQSTPNIRGQASSNESPGLDVPVGMFIDDVYYGGPASYSADFYDVSQIAVLKGPQGTTFGRNVVGGAIQVTSQRPVFGDDSGEVSATVKNYNGFETRGFVNHQVSDTLAARVAYSVKQRDGYDYNVVTNTHINDEKIWGVRGSLRYRPNDDLDINFIMSYSRQDNFGDAPKFVGPGSLVASQSPDPHTVYLDENGINRRKIWANVLNIAYSTSLGTFSSITGYHSLVGAWRDDVDARPTPIFWPSTNFNRESSFSQEFRLVSPSGQRIEYVVGVYGSLDHAYKDLVLSANGCDTTLFFNTLNTAGGNPCNRIASLNQSVHIGTIAPYGEAKWNITDQLSLTLGGRYSYITKKGFTNHFGSSFSYGPAYNAVFDTSFSAFTPRAVAQYKITPDSMIFASFAKGFKSGGFSESATSLQAAETPLRPEKSTSLEIGTKNEFLDKRVMLNLTAYRARTKDLQTKNFVGSLFIETNAGEVEVKGIELELSVRPVRGLDIGVNYALTDAKYRSFKNCTASRLDCSGNRLPNTPRNDTLVHAQYSMDLADGAGLDFRGDIKWTSPVYAEQTNATDLFAHPLTRISGLLNGSVQYRPPSGRWDFQIWGKNLTNKNYIVYSANYYFFAVTKAEFAAGLNDVDRSLFGAPRTYGATLNYRF